GRQERDRIGGQEPLDRLRETVLVADARREPIRLIGVPLRRIGRGDRLVTQRDQLSLCAVEGVVVETGVPAPGACGEDPPAHGQGVVLVSVTLKQWTPGRAYGTPAAPKVTWRRPHRGGSPAMRPVDGSNRECPAAPGARSRV